MKKTAMIFLPGLDKQLLFLKNTFELANKKVLIIGAGSEFIALDISAMTNQPVEIIVDNSDSLLLTRLNLSQHENISCSMMGFDSTDFKGNSFDLVYAQASVSTPNRKKILGEIFRILKPESYFCCGEIINLKHETPRFIQNILSSSNLSPLDLSDLKNLYDKLNFAKLYEKDLSSTLKLFFEKAKLQAEIAAGSWQENEKSFHKKLLHRFAHESNSFLKFGADKYLGFYAFLFQKRS